MKKIFLLLLLLFSGITAQNKQDFVVMRGDSLDITFQPIAGNDTLHTLRFAVKSDYTITSSRLIDITTIGKSYNSVTGKTTISLSLAGSETADLSAKTYYYDLCDETTKRTLFSGKFIVNADVITPFDGTNLTAGSTRYVPVDTGKVANGFIPKRSGNDFVGYDLLGNHYTKPATNTLLNGKVNKILPTSTSGLSSGDWWNDNGTVKIIP